MTDEHKISVEELGLWKQHNVTQQFFELLRQRAEIIKQSFLNENLPYNQACGAYLANMHGMLDVINRVLDINIDDFNQESEENAQ